MKIKEVKIYSDKNGKNKGEPVANIVESESWESYINKFKESKNDFNSTETGVFELKEIGTGINAYIRLENGQFVNLFAEKLK